MVAPLSPCRCVNWPPPRPGFLQEKGWVGGDPFVHMCAAMKIRNVRRRCGPSSFIRRPDAGCGGHWTRRRRAPLCTSVSRATGYSSGSTQARRPSRDNPSCRSRDKDERSRRTRRGNLLREEMRRFESDQDAARLHEAAARQAAGEKAEPTRFIFPSVDGGERGQSNKMVRRRDDSSTPVTE